MTLPERLYAQRRFEWNNNGKENRQRPKVR
jgi:hypothetical protein